MSKYYSSTKTKLQQYNTRMQSSQILSSLDISLTITSITNHLPISISNIYFTIQIVSDNDFVPYQILGKKAECKSSNNFYSYITPIVNLGGFGKALIQETVVFKGYVEVQEEGWGQFRIGLREVREGNDILIEEKVLRQSFLKSLNHYIPCLFPKNSISLDITAHSQLLTLKYTTLSNIPRLNLFTAIDTLIISYNKLRQRVVELTGLTIETIDIERYKKIGQIKKSRRIFSSHFQNFGRTEIQEFVKLFFPEVGGNLLRLWNIFLKNILDEKVQDYKQQFMKTYALQLNQQTSPNHPSPQNLLINGMYLPSIPTKSLIPEASIKDLLDSRSQKQLNTSIIQLLGTEPHVVFIVHGYGASQLATKDIEVGLRYYFPGLTVVSSRVNSFNMEFCLEELGKRLAIQVENYLKESNFGENFSLSFICHSLGGLIVRSSLTHLQSYHYNMKGYISLSTPHLGHLYHNSHLTKLGMWALTKTKNSKVMKMLLMEDHENVRKSEIYLLSLKGGLDWFEEVVFYGCDGDRFVSPMSALVVGNQDIQGDLVRNKDKGLVWEEMRSNIEKMLSETKTTKIEVDFENYYSEKIPFIDELLGRKDHMALCNCEEFVAGLILRNFHIFS